MRAGETYENPVTGERATVIEGSADNPERRLRTRLFVRPGGAVVGEHFHPAIDERFTVVAGTIGYRLDGEEGVAGPGATIDIPRGTLHDWWNAGDDELEAVVEVVPADRFERLIETLWALGRDGDTNAKGVPNPLQLALTAKEFRDTMVLTSPPRLVQQTMFAVLGPLARALGYRAEREYGPPVSAEGDRSDAPPATALRS
jgi:quercetin dioxygenase-like cupin family protein